MLQASFSYLHKWNLIFSAFYLIKKLANTVILFLRCWKVQNFMVSTWTEWHSRGWDKRLLTCSRLTKFNFFSRKRANFFSLQNFLGGPPLYDWSLRRSFDFIWSVPGLFLGKTSKLLEISKICGIEASKKSRCVVWGKIFSKLVLLFSLKKTRKQLAIKAVNNVESINTRSFEYTRI